MKNQSEAIEKYGEKKVQPLKYLESPDKELPSIKSFILEGMLYFKSMNELEITREQKQKIDRTTRLFKGYKTI